MAEYLTSSSLKLLECSLCHNVLSFFPIFLWEGRNICGRCPVNDNAIRNNVYEVIANFQRFPCRYQNKGCFVKLTPKDIQDHEENCPAREIKCPMSNCTWSESLSSLINHCQEEHLQQILKSNQEFILNLEDSYELDKFCVYDNKLFIVSLEFNVKQKILECLITEYESQDQPDTTYSCLSTLKFAKRSCTTEFNIDTITRLLYLEMLDNQETTNIIAWFKITKTLQELTHFNENHTLVKLLSTLKCTSCSTSLLPTMYLSSNDLFYCNLCAAAESFTSQISSLNLISDLVEVSCKHQKDGCTFVANASVMPEHVCQFEIVKCVFLDCLWANQRKSLRAHLETIKHSSRIQSNDFSAYFSLDAGNQFKFVVFTFKSFVFRFVANMHNNEICCSVQAANTSPRNFKYEIKVQDRNKCGDSLIMQKSCTEFQDAEFVHHSEKNNYCYLTMKQVNSFLVKKEERDGVSFRVLVFSSF